MSMSVCKLTPAAAAAIAKRGPKLLRVCKLTHRDLAILDCLLWSCRDPVTGAIVVSYTALCRLANASREAVAGAVRRLQATGPWSCLRWCCPGVALPL